jgi:hypothetical protein
MTAKELTDKPYARSDTYSAPSRYNEVALLIFLPVLFRDAFTDRWMHYASTSQANTTEARINARMLQDTEVRFLKPISGPCFNFLPASYNSKLVVEFMPLSNM